MLNLTMEDGAQLHSSSTSQEKVEGEWGLTSTSQEKVEEEWELITGEGGGGVELYSFKAVEMLTPVLADRWLVSDSQLNWLSFDRTPPCLRLTAQPHAASPHSTLRLLPEQPVQDCGCAGQILVEGCGCTGGSRGPWRSPPLGER